MSNSPFDFPVSGRVDPQLLAGMRELVAVIHRSGTESKEAGDSAKRAATDWQAVRDRVSQAAEAFNHVVTAGGRVIGVVVSTAQTLAHSAGEAERLSRASRDLGVNFDDAARSAGGVVDQIDILNATNTLAARGIALNQAQLNAFARTAQDYARGSGKEFREVSEQLAEVVAKGGEEAARFGPALAALAAPTAAATDRLDALVRTTRESAPAARTAAEDFRDFQQAMTEAQRSFSEGFAEGIVEMRRVHGETTSARDAMRELKDDVYALGGATGEVVARIGAGVVVLVGGLISGIGSVLGLLSAAGAGMEALVSRRDVRAAAAAEYRAVMTTGFMGEVTRAVANQLQVLTRDFAGGQRSSTAPVEVGGGAADRRRDAAARGADMTFTLEETQRGNRSGGRATAAPRPAADMTFGQDEATYGAEGLRLRREAVERAAELRERAGMDELIAEERRRQQHQRGSTLGDMMDDRAAARERRTLEQRIDGLQSFTDRWRDLHHEQVDVTREATTFLDAGLKGLGQSVTTHGKAILAGGEQAARGLRSILSETAGAFADESFMKAGFYAAEAIAALVRWDLPGAGTAAAASAAYLVAGAGASAIGAAAAPPALPSMSGAMPGGGPGGGAQPVGPRGDKSGEGGGTNINITFGGPVVGGSAAQIGRELGRYLNTANTQTGFQLAPGVAATR